MSGIVHVTTVHKRKDIRIFQKELRSLSREFENITLIVNDGLGNETVDGIQIIDLGISYKTRLGRFIKPFFRVVKVLKEMKPDLIHFHDPELMIMGIAMGLKGYPVIYDSHEDLARDVLDKVWIPKPLRRLSSTLVNTVEHFALRFFRAVIFVIESQIPRLGFKKHIVLHNYPVLANYSEQSVAPAEPYFIHIGTLTEVRGLQEMLDALSLLPDEYSLVLAGPFLPSAYELAQKHPAWERVRYFQWLERKELIEMTRKALAGLILFHPLPNMLSCSPNKIFEYMASGIPVIASNFKDFAEMMGEKECGLLVDPKDHRSVYDAMVYFIRNPQERERMGVNGLRKVHGEYSWEKESEKLLALYHDILGTKDNSTIDKEAVL